MSSNNNFGIKIDFTKSSGSWVYDINTKRRLLDMLSHFNSLTLGYNHDCFTDENYHNEIATVISHKVSLCEYSTESVDSFMEVFHDFINLPEYKYAHFACTGALAVEAAVKASWAHHDYKRTKVISITNSFHGVNSFGNFLSTSSRLDGTPMNSTFIRSTIDELLYSCSKEYLGAVAAIIVEPIQCTYGDHYIAPGDLTKIRVLCNDHNIVLIYDEIQTGLSTGTPFYSHRLPDTMPDIIVFGKRFQVSGILCKQGFDKIKEDFWRLKVTFDGSLIDMIRCKYMLKSIMKRELLEQSLVYGVVLREALEKIPGILNVRGIGSLCAFDMDSAFYRDYMYKHCLKNGLMINPTGEKTIRLRPNLAVTRQEINQTLNIISDAARVIYRVKATEHT